ncbi:MAG: hypothetical protein WEF86_14815 [Gemmatimonadota bacterium]
MRAPSTVAVLTTALMASGCVHTYETQIIDASTAAVTQQPLKSASNLPPTFVVVTPGASGGDCPLRLRDDGLRTMLTLARTLRIPIRDSAATTYETFGDYAVLPPGAYGDTEGDALRIDCGVLRALGVVRLIE